MRMRPPCNHSKAGESTFDLSLRHFGILSRPPRDQQHPNSAFCHLNRATGGRQPWVDSLLLLRHQRHTNTMARAGRWQLLLAGVALLAGTTCCRAAHAKAKTQANCACLPSWTDTNGTTHTGCANPDNDPLGTWCPVSPSSCLGYYSSFTNASGAAVFYDYCSDVRERTLQGCLCAPEWNMGPGRLGKERYADGCASPDKRGVRICRVDLATCPESSTAGEFDACGPGPEQPPAAPPAAAAAEALQLTGPSPGDAGAAAGAAAAAKAATFHGCACEQWSYEWSDGSRANFSGCANPDGDPQGSWCGVDPVTCDNFAGEMRTGNQTIAYDYCDVHYRSAPADICGVVLDRFSQCGGKSNCTAFGCVDAPWPGACCAAGLSCVRQQPFYHQCAAPGDLAAADAAAAAAAQQAQADGVVVGGSGGSLVDFIPTAAGGLQSSSSSGSREDDGDAASILSGSSLAADILASSGSSLLDPAQQQQQQPPAYVMPTLAWTQGAAAGGGEGDGGSPLMPLTPAFLPKQPGQKVYTKLRIDADYDALVGSPLKLSHFKADLVTWLKAVAANPEHIYGAGVDQVLSGSVVAVAFVQLTSDAPPGEGAAALARLSSSDASAAYSSSGLRSDWGPLMSFIVAPSRAELSSGGGGNGVEEYGAAQTAAPGAAGGGRVSGKAALTAGAVVGISLGGAALVGLAGFVLGRALASERARRHDADLDAKIAYYGELQEGDLHGLEGDEEEEEGEGEDDSDDGDGGGSQARAIDEEEEEGAGGGGGAPLQRPGQGAHGRGWWWLRRPAESLQQSGAEAEMVQQAGPRSPAHVCRCPNGPSHDSDGGAAPPAAAAAAAAGVASLKQRRVSVVSLSSAGGSSASGGGSSSNYSQFRSSTTGGGAAGAQQAAGLPPHAHHPHHHLHHHQMQQVAAAAVLPLDKEQ